MSGTVAFIIPGKAVAKGRSRMTRNGHAYTPRKTENYEAYVKLLATRAMRDHKRFEREALRLRVKVTLQIPASWPSRKRWAACEGKIQPIGRPDLDNLVKTILDAGNTIIYRDDAQVCRIEAEKLYGVVPQTEVIVSEVIR